jgi:hypothetical protein
MRAWQAFGVQSDPGLSHSSVSSALAEPIDRSPQLACRVGAPERRERRRRRQGRHRIVNGKDGSR